MGKIIWAPSALKDIESIMEPGIGILDRNKKGLCAFHYLG